MMRAFGSAVTEQDPATCILVHVDQNVGFRPSRVRIRGEGKGKVYLSEGEKHARREGLLRPTLGVDPRGPKPIHLHSGPRGSELEI